MATKHGALRMANGKWQNNTGKSMAKTMAQHNGN